VSEVEEALLDGRFRTNSPPVVHETVDGETIVVNLDTGSYYDLNETGGSIFGMLGQGVAMQELTTLLAKAYELDETTAARILEDFAGRLVAEQLLVPAASAADPNGGPSELPGRYAEPVLNKYTDMQELLLLDPVHEVGEVGWPSQA
jgi:hypothetical protein